MSVRRWIGLTWLVFIRLSLPAETEDRPSGEKQAALPGPGKTAETAIAASGTLPEGSEWRTFAQCEAKADAVHILEIPVHGQTEEIVRRDVRPMDQRPVDWILRPVEPLDPDREYVFRVLPLETLPAMEVADWPEARNRWTLTLRVRPIRPRPTRYGLVLQAAPRGAPVTPSVAESTSSSDLPHYTVEVVTEPPGAEIRVDDEPYLGDGRPLVAPCRMSIPEGTHSFVLRLAGYEDAQFPDVSIRRDMRLNWKFVRKQAETIKDVTVSARLGWQSSGVLVSPGQPLLIQAVGTWSCGQGLDPTGAEGYPDSVRPRLGAPGQGTRQLAEAPYGKLLMRIGREGRIVAIGRRCQGVAPIGGIVYFDINETPGPARRDNQGALKVRIQLLPAE